MITECAEADYGAVFRNIISAHKSRSRTIAKVLHSDIVEISNVSFSVASTVAYCNLSVDKVGIDDGEVYFGILHGNIILSKISYRHESRCISRVSNHTHYQVATSLHALHSVIEEHTTSVEVDIEFRQNQICLGISMRFQLERIIAFGLLIRI